MFKLKKTHVHCVLTTKPMPYLNRAIISMYSFFYSASSIYLGDNFILNFHLGMYIVGYTVRDLVLGRCPSRAVKHDLQPYI